MNSDSFVKDVVVVSGKDKCPQGYEIINTTVNGNDANLYESSFLKKDERYICFTKNQISPTGNIITDLMIAKEKDSFDLTGFTAVRNCSNDASEKSFRKHVLYIKTESLESAKQGVVNLIAVQPSKGEKFNENFFKISNDVNGIHICFQKIPVPNIKQQPPHPDVAMHVQAPKIYGYPSNDLPYPTQNNIQSDFLPNTNRIKSMEKQTLGIQGVMFEINPRFQRIWKIAKVSQKFRQIRSIRDIDLKYNYTFEMERIILSR